MEERQFLEIISQTPFIYSCCDDFQWVNILSDSFSDIKRTQDREALLSQYRTVL